jgi:hypothetical protein
MRCELLGRIVSSIATERATYMSSAHCCRYEPLARLIDELPSENLDTATEHILLSIDTTALK